MAPNTGRTYYYNTVTRQTQYEVPDEILHEHEQQEQQQQQQEVSRSPQVLSETLYKLAKSSQLNDYSAVSLKVWPIYDFCSVLHFEEDSRCTLVNSK